MARNMRKSGKLFGYDPNKRTNLNDTSFTAPTNACHHFIMSPTKFGQILNKLKHIGPSQASPSVDLDDTTADEQVYRYRKQRGVNLGKELTKFTC